MAECDDPVAVIATNTQLQIKLSEDLEVIMVVDRAVTTWKNDEHFYLFQTPDGGMVVMWSDEDAPRDTLSLEKLQLCPCHLQMRCEARTQCLKRNK